MKSTSAPKNKKFELIFAGQKSVRVIQKLNTFFSRLPHLPKKVINFIVAVLPWLVLLGGIVSFIAVSLSFVLAVLSIIALDINLILIMTGSLLMVWLNALLLIKAFKPLRGKNAVGWMYLFWANVLGVVNSLINIINSDISGLDQISLTILLTLLGFYLLFEIAASYTYDK